MEQMQSPVHATALAEMPEVFEQYYVDFIHAYRIRHVEKQLLQLFKEGKVYGTVHTSVGQEFSALFVAKYLQEDDVVFSNHRCHGHYIARTGDVKGLIAEIMGKASGACKGFGGSQHLCNRGFFSNGIQGGIVPVSTGIALHHKLEDNGAIAVVYLGDGTFGEGAIYEAFNMASVWGLPLLAVVEDNMYAQSTSSRQTFAGSFDGRARGFGITYYESSIWDLPELDSTARAAVAHVRVNRRPAILRIQQYRLEAHSKGDDDRDPQEIALYRSRDPLTQFLATREECEETQRALAIVRDDVGQLIREIEKEDCFALRPQLRSPRCAPVRYQAVTPESLTQVKAINAALDAFLRTFPTAIILGEDIHSPYGGAFKATRDLSMRYPQQVYTTPISEAGILGVANGLALMGRKVVAEIMFGDFVTLAFDQIVNHAAKFKQMYGMDRGISLVVRTPMGGGRGYGPTHSQSLEKHLVGVPGTQLFVLHGRTRVQRFYQELLSGCDTPSVVIENKTLYTTPADQALPPEYQLMETTATFPATVLKPQGEADITIVAFGSTSLLAEQVAARLQEEDEIVAELVFPLQVYPLDVSAVMDSVQRTRRLVVVEEGTQGFDLGSEVIASLAAGWTGSQPFRVKRLAAKEMALPSALPLEKKVLPSAAELQRLCVELYND
jgi:2-oxoisovalerate dehydrogenase E1 component